MSATSRRTVYVGLFVFVALLIFGGAILAVGSLKNSFSSKLTVHAVFDEVGGLQSGDSVWSSGVRVGIVDDLGFVDAGEVEVDLLLDVAMVPFIPADAVATIGSDGLIGNPIVVLSGGTRGGPSVTEGEKLQVGEAVSTTQIMETLQKNNENLVEITDDIKALTGKLRAGEGTLGRLLNEDGLYNDVEAALTDVRAASANAEELTASLAQFSAQLNEPGQLPHDLVHDEEMMPTVRAALDDLQATASTVSEIADGLKDDLANPKSPVGVLVGDQEAGSDLKQTLSNLEEATILLNEDLVAIRSNFLFRPYFKKQEREARKAAKQAEKAKE